MFTSALFKLEALILITQTGSLVIKGEEADIKSKQNTSIYLWKAHSYCLPVFVCLGEQSINDLDAQK